MTTQKNNAILSFMDVSVYYGIIEAIHGISFDVQKGQIVTLVGANGAGKSTTLRAISGLVTPKTGSILFKGENIAGLPAHEIVRKRLCHAPEGRGIFLNLTVEENMDLGAWAAPNKAAYQANIDQGFQMFPRLKERRSQLAGTLSGGEQQMLAIARALMGQPEVLLLDEPSLGLAPQIIEKIFEIITDINKTGMTIILVEQNALQALQIAHYGIVLETGRIKTHGQAADLLKSDEIRKAYLGD
jgi:branched-chain amino acid transport system ATP-binding protein